MSDSEENDFVVLQHEDAEAEEDLDKPLRRIDEITAWLGPTDYLGESSEFRRHIISHVAGTSDWVVNTNQYHLWHDSPDHGSLWMKAVAGAGKSVLSAWLISHLQRTEEGVPVLFFFCRQIVAANHDRHSIVRDWLTQLLEFSPPLQAKLSNFMEEKRSSKDIAFDEFWHVLIRSLKALPKVYCLVDALDELDDTQTHDFLENLVALGRARPECIKLLMTSRPLPQIQKVLNTPSVLQMRLENRQINKDISVFMQHRLIKTTQMNSTVREIIQRSVEDRVYPSFLYARLMLNELINEQNGEDTLTSASKALLSLPSSLEDMYSQMLHDHAKRGSVPPERQLLILQLVTHATRPLRLLEIASVFDTLGRGSEDTKNLVRMGCGPLIEILGDETVSIIHHSFTEFLTDVKRQDLAVNENCFQFPVIDSVHTHHLLALTCLRYLSSGCLSEWKLTDLPARGYFDRQEEQLRAVRLQSPFLDYAMNNWFVHVRQLPALEDDLLKELDAFINPENHTFSAWIDAVVRPKYQIQSTSPLHMCAWTGLTTYAKRLLQAGAECNKKDDNRNTALLIAAQQGHLDIVNLLLEYGAEPDEPDISGRKPLHLAARANYHTIVQRLLDAGVSPMTKRISNDSSLFMEGTLAHLEEPPLGYACQSGCLESVRAMLPRLSDEDLHSALHWAIGSKQLTVAKFLLEHPGINVNAEVSKITFLFVAAKNRHYEMIKVLLEKGATPTARSRNFPAGRLLRTQFNRKYPGYTCLHALSERFIRTADIVQRNEEQKNIERCFDLLIDAGCDINAVDDRGRTPLHGYALHAFNIVDKALRHGAAPNAVDNTGSTPLHLFSPTTTAAPILDSLIRHGARWDIIREQDGKTALHTALDSNTGLDLECIKPYVRDWNIPDASGNTPLHLVMGKGELVGELVGELIKLGANPNLKNHSGQLPIHRLRNTSSNINFQKGIPPLLAAGCDIDARDNEGRTLFLRTLPDISMEMAVYFFELGANRHATDFEGNGALHLACKTQAPKMHTISWLLEVGCNALHVNYLGENLLHVLAPKIFRRTYRWSPLQLLSLLVSKGIPITARNNRGQTFLHYVCMVPPQDTRRLRSAKEDPLDHLLKSGGKALLEMEDNEGRRPMHTAAACCEHLVDCLIRRGADIHPRTHKGETPLHIAASARQSNVIGLLLEQYSDAEKQKIVNATDRTGRTPLHYACSSGRPESVDLLLKAGADPMIKCSSELTPLHTCAEFTANNILPPKTNAGVIERLRCFRTEDETVRIQEIISLLRARGANILATSEQGQTPFDLAVNNACEGMVVALAADREKMALDRQATVESEAKDEDELIGLSFPAALLQRDRSAEWYWLCRAEKFKDLVDKIIDQKETVAEACHRLLQLRAFPVLEELGKRNVDFSQKSRHYDNNNFLSTLARWGYADLFKKLGNSMQDPSWINGKMSPGKFDTHRDTLPYLSIAATRDLPNLEIFRVILDTFQADINIQIEQNISVERGNVSVPDGSVLHILSKGQHWWHTEAVRMLLKHSPKLQLRNASGETPLHVAAKGGYRRYGIARVLLEHGADPNALDNKTLAPLNLAVGDPEMVKLLLDHGADIGLCAEPLLFNAIKRKDLDTVRVLLDAGVDPNKPFRPAEPLPEVVEREFEKAGSISEWELAKRRALESRPLHFAASPALKKGPYRNTALAIIQLLMDYGADPLLPYNDNTTIIHDLVQQDGILEPLFSPPSFDLESRDKRGRTVFLAACEQQHRRPWVYSPYEAGIVPEESASMWDRNLPRTIYGLAADPLVTDNDGNNALHLLIEAGLAHENYDTISFLLSKHPSLIHHKNNEGWKPFHLAIQKRHFQLLQAFLDAGADPKEPDLEGNIILHHLLVAIPIRSTELQDRTLHTVINELLGQGLDINAKNTQGETPLFKFIGSFRSPISLESPNPSCSDVQEPNFKLLVDAGANLFETNNEGETLLHLISKQPVPRRGGLRTFEFNHLKRQYGEFKTLETFKLLMELGLDPLKEDFKQRTAIDVAAAYGNEDILALFQTK